MIMDYKLKNIIWDYNFSEEELTDLAERLANFRFEQFEQIRWNENYNWKELESDRDKILHSIVGL